MGLLPKGQLEPVAGRILLEGEDLLRASDRRLRQLRCTRMSMIFQEPMTALNPVMTCGEQIDEVLRTHTDLPPAARTERILAIMRDVRLPDPELMPHAYPHQLSGGQRQRIMIAMALVLEPALLIADEPTTALDVTTQAQILQLIKDIQREHGTAVLFITHDFGVVAEIADRVAVMQWGKVVEAGETEQVLARPRHPYTRMLIGSVPGLAPKQREPAAAPDVVLRTVDLTKVYGGGWFQQARGARGRSGQPRGAARRDARHRRRVRLRQDHRRPLHRPPDRPDRRRDLARGRGDRPPQARAGCARTAGASRSCSRTPTARSTRAAPWAPRSSKGR